VKQCIGCDLHRDYSVFASMDESGRVEGPWRVDRGLRPFGNRCNWLLSLVSVVSVVSVARYRGSGLMA
jgi:hypothetical protein